RETKDECLFAVLVSVGDRDTAQDLVAETFARAWVSWRTVSGHPAPAAQNPACRSYPMSGSPAQRRHLMSSIVSGPQGSDFMIIHPSALPSGAGLQIAAQFRHYPAPRGDFQVDLGLVSTSPQCTGS
ncbi:MAG: hypothetical protein ACRDNF_06490, partial [Streptosporangiaceae bacterium]